MIPGLVGPPPGPRPPGPAPVPRPLVPIPKPASLGDLILRPSLPGASTAGASSASDVPATAGAAGAGGPPAAAAPPGRADLQVVAQPAKANQAAAKATAVDPERLAAWLVKLAEREFAPTSVGPKAAKLKLMEWLLKMLVNS